MRLRTHAAFRVGCVRVVLGIGYRCAGRAGSLLEPETSIVTLHAINTCIEICALLTQYSSLSRCSKSSFGFDAYSCDVMDCRVEYIVRETRTIRTRLAR